LDNYLPFFQKGTDFAWTSTASPVRWLILRHKKRMGLPRSGESRATGHDGVPVLEAPGGAYGKIRAPPHPGLPGADTGASLTET